jgi:hypothetical protein
LEVWTQEELGAVVTWVAFDFVDNNFGCGQWTAGFGFLA